ncbi:mechanosensitive ion channel family protein [Halanaerobium hydrogeniformans]|uniref:MscS Mechanosensitive ion channel n=1 Tax=Halanaerobium hydrogeniformans TaxID=656519 RepID=E4RN92_HALHG|nr:mechanosensitive ion channel family protein [Halanaerobium hydrogeniformans]ADQ14309.1 MscS Mechanosensitive ion channel [Halanaerobium hydrogeniformans]
MQNLNLNTIIFNNTILNYLRAFIFIISVYLLIKLFDKFLLDRVNIFIDKFSHSFAELLKKLIKKRLYPLLYFLTVYIAFNQLRTIDVLDTVITAVLMILTVFFAVLIIQDIITYLLRKHWEKKERSTEENNILTITLFIIKAIIWIVAFLFILDNLNIEITGLVTGLGIGGIAIAFAAQNILNDLFNYFTIYFDKPFDVGDYIVISDYRGTIEHIGIKTTRLRSISGEELIISNTDLVNSRINNLKRMQRRRINFNFGIEYGTPLEKIKQIPGIVEEIIKAEDKTEFDRAHFEAYGDFSLKFQVVFFVQSREYRVYMDIQQNINYKLNEKFNELGINFAFPTQTIHLQDGGKNNDNSKL